MAVSRDRVKMTADKPNILLIMADDIGWFDVGAYHRGLMGTRTPNIDRIAAEGVMFTDAYAQASCTAGGRRSSPASFRCGLA